MVSLVVLVAAGCTQARGQSPLVVTVGTETGHNPAIRLAQTLVEPNTSVLVTAEGFPAGQPVRLFLGFPNSEAGVEIFGEGTVGPGGTVEIEMTIPAGWPRGALYPATEVVVLAATPDFRFQATAPLQIRALAHPAPRRD